MAKPVWKNRWERVIKQSTKRNGNLSSLWDSREATAYKAKLNPCQKTVRSLQHWETKKWVARKRKVGCQMSTTQ